MPPRIHPFSHGRPFGRLPVRADRNKASEGKALAVSAVIQRDVHRGELPGGGVSLHPGSQQTLSDRVLKGQWLPSQAVPPERLAAPSPRPPQAGAVMESGLPGVCEGPASVRRKGEGPNGPEGEADGRRRPTEPRRPAGSPGAALPVPAATAVERAGLLHPGCGPPCSLEPRQTSAGHSWGCPTSAPRRHTSWALHMHWPAVR